MLNRRNKAVLVLAAAGSWVLNIPTTSADTDTVPEELLSSQEASQTYGGLEIQSFTKPSDNDVFLTDDIPLEIDLRHQLLTETSIILETRVNGDKSDAMIVTTNQLNAGWLEGNVERRMKWPLAEGGNATLSLTICDIALNNCNVSPTAGPSQKINLELPGHPQSSGPAVKVSKIWFHNTFDGSESTSVSPSQVKELVDNTENNYRLKTLNGGVPNLLIHATNSVDAVMDQCVGSRFQFRQHKLDSVELNTIRPVTPDSNDSSENYDAYIDATGIEDYLDVNDPESGAQYLHVFFVKAIDWDDDGNGVPEGTADGYAPWQGSPHPNIHAILIRENLSPFIMSTVLAHEIGHHYMGIGHVNASDCSVANYHPQLVSLNPLMCPTPGAGRLMSANECSRFYDLFFANIPVIDYND